MCARGEHVAESGAPGRTPRGARPLDRRAAARPNTVIVDAPRPTLFADWLTWQWGRHDGQGVLRLPLGNGRHAPIASVDLAKVIAAILANPAPHDRQIYPLYGPEEFGPLRDCAENGADVGHSGAFRTRRHRIFCGCAAGTRSVPVPRAVPKQRSA